MTGITLILSTFNRAEALNKTLEAFARLDRANLDVEFVVVDNNSKDQTPQVIQSFLDKLPLVHLSEPRPGKNCALNLALDKVVLKDIVVFTDDDVTPDQDWLHQIAASVEKWPESSVFGGKVSVLWPGDGKAPDWCGEKWLQAICFVRHEYGEQDQPYPVGEFPFGPNFWVRSKVFQGGMRYNETLGPRPTKRLMGSETSFLIALSLLGHQPIYVPGAHVLHRVNPSEVTQKAVITRVFRAGRTQPHLRALRMGKDFKVSIFGNVVEFLHALASITLSYLPGNAARRFSSRCGGIVRLGKSLESFKFLFKQS